MSYFQEHTLYRNLLIEYGRNEGKMYHIILNPASKSGRGIAIWKELEPIMVEREIPYRLIYSDHVGHICELVHKLCLKLDEDPSLILNIVVLGGDGTINEAIQGITDFSRVRLGYIPTGSSNDLARDLDYPTDPKEILNRIIDGSVKRTMDLGVLTYKTLFNSVIPDGSATVFAVSNNDSYDEVTSRRFLTSTGIGFDAAVCEEALRDGSKSLLNKLGLGKLTYVTIALKHILGAKSVACDIILDGERTIHYNKFLFVATMNHRYEGGGFMFCPDAVDDDGILNLCVVGDLPKYKMLMALPTAYKGNHFRFRGIEPYKASTVEIKTDAPLWLHTDGEVYYQSNHVEIKCIPGAIQFLA